MLYQFSHITIEIVLNIWFARHIRIVTSQCYLILHKIHIESVYSLLDRTRISLSDIWTPFDIWPRLGLKLSPVQLSPINHWFHNRFRQYTSISTFSAGPSYTVPAWSCFFLFSRVSFIPTFGLLVIQWRNHHTIFLGSSFPLYIHTTNPKVV